jgi:alkylhydroperoxidase family enzyme
MQAIEGDYLASEKFSDAEKAAMRWAEVLTLKQYHGAPGAPPQSEPAMAELKRHYNEAQIVEITMVSGFFNFWNRFTDGLQIDIEDAGMMTRFGKSARIDAHEFTDYMRACWWNEDN